MGQPVRIERRGEKLEPEVPQPSYKNGFGIK